MTSSSIIARFLKDGWLWNNSIEMQESMSLSEKGWQVEVAWRDAYTDDGTCIGIGVFANENISTGTVLRRGLLGRNLLVFDSKTIIPITKDKSSAEYLKNYAHVCPCNVDDQDQSMVVWLPGSGLNHSVDPNTRKICNEEGVYYLATRNIAEGDAITCDYGMYGVAPSWFTDMLEERLGSKDCMFQGFNDFV